MSLVGSDNRQKGEQKESQTTEEQFEKTLKERAALETEKLEVPDSLKPENIEKMLEARAGKRNGKKYRWKPLYTMAAAAACCVLIIGIAVIGGQSGQKQKMDTASTKEAGQTGEKRQ